MHMLELFLNNPLQEQNYAQISKEYTQLTKNKLVGLISRAEFLIFEELYA